MTTLHLRKSIVRLLVLLLAFLAFSRLLAASPLTTAGSSRDGNDLGLTQPATDFFDGSPLGGGWFYSSWFGYYNSNSYPWIYHNELGWMYVSGTGSDNIWMYSSDPGWIWFARNTFPFLWSDPDQAWLWWLQGSHDPLWLFNLTTGQWQHEFGLTPASDLLGTWIGNGSYYDYTFDDNNNLIPNALVYAQFTFFFTNPGNGSTNFACWVQILSFQQLAPNQDFIPEQNWGIGIAPIAISSSRWTGDNGGFDAWSFSFTTNTMAGSVTRDPGNNAFFGINSTGINGITLTKQGN